MADRRRTRRGRDVQPASATGGIDGISRAPGGAMAVEMFASRKPGIGVGVISDSPKLSRAPLPYARRLAEPRARTAGLLPCAWRLSA
jgi:hypothetical protein